MILLPVKGVNPLQKPKARGQQDLVKDQQNDGDADYLAAAQINFLNTELVQDGERFIAERNRPSADKQQQGPAELLLSQGQPVSLMKRI
jgi:hypothetical protein